MTTFNVAVCGAYEPGSTFKVIAHGAAIDQGLVNLGTHFHCHWGYLEGLELTDLGKYGSISVRKILAVSSNIGTYKIAKKLAPGDYFNYILNMGFQEKTGIRLTAEKPGRVPHPDRWHNNTLSRLAMGYGVQASPLQVCSMMNTICNDGTYVQPAILKSIEKDDGTVVGDRSHRRVRSVFSPETAEKLRKSLVNVVESGTGKAARMVGVSVGGKTGTADKWDLETKTYHKDRNVASFLGFLPAEAPRLVGYVLVDDPQTESRGGGSSAAPIFKNIMERALPILGVDVIVDAGGNE